MCEQYEIFRDLTTKLLNNILCFQTKLQMHEIAGSHVPPHAVNSLSSSCEIAKFGSPLGDVSQLNFSILSEEPVSGSRIGTGVVDEEDGLLNDSAPISEDSINMPNPFRDIPKGSNITLPANFWTVEDKDSTSGQSSHLIPPSDQSDIPHHPLSAITESSRALSGSGGSSCPGMEHFYTIKKNELLYGPRLGCGSTGQVFKMWYCGAPVAVKIMNFPKLLDTQERLVHESKMHIRLAHHPNIVQFYGQCVGMENSDDAVGLVMELCDLGSLLQAVREARWIQYLEQEGHDLGPYEKTIGYAFYTNWPLRIKMACDVAAGMEFLHSRDIVHRDLTSYNIVISQGGRQGNVWVAKVCDFERSRHVPAGSTIPRSDNIPNSPAWAAPEVLRNEDYSTQADVFSMGVILWEIVTLEEPWKEHFSKCIKDPYHVIALVSNQERLPIPAPKATSIPEFLQLTALIEDAWKETAQERPTMKKFHQRIFDIQKQVVHRLRNQVVPPH